MVEIFCLILILKMLPAFVYMYFSQLKLRSLEVLISVLATIKTNFTAYSYFFCFFKLHVLTPLEQ